MVVSNTALELVQQEVINEFSISITHIGLGDDNTPPTETDNTLGNEFVRESLFSQIIETDRIRSVIFLDIADANGNTIRESGQFDSATAGNMLTRTLTNEIQKDNNTEVFVEEDIIVEAINL